MRWRISLILFISLVALLACNFGVTPAAQVTFTSPAATSAPQPTPTASLPPPDRRPLFERVGAVPITLLTPEEGVGQHPKFEWQPVQGATRYVLLLITTDDKPYWAWEGTETAVYLGGGSEPPPADSIGPILLRPMKWYVLALDANGKLIGYSEPRPIAP